MADNDNACKASEGNEGQFNLHGSAPVVEITNLWTKFGRTVVHQDLNLEIERGEILSIVGGSGTGKTVLLRQMLGLEHPARGCVKVFGEDINKASSDQLQQLRNHWGMLFQQGALYSALTVFDNVAQPMRELRVLPEALVRDAVLLKMNMVGLGPEHALKMPSDLSGGMIKRVALARALALEPKLLFLDEPTAGLDPDLSESFVSLIQSLHRELGLTVVMVTHDLDTLFALSTRIAVLAEKHVIAIGPTREVIEVDHPFIKQFFLGDRGKRALAVLDEKQAADKAAQPGADAGTDKKAEK
ncbi:MULTISPECIES: ABC transporter ATP-binding protein [unclassified Janthinobacterium]|uniref:ABC transporter ATP-binding protein n=1 Tax=unclassified Janthinobacterium TaxID=2610881 RepID=UPI000C6FE70A|nr:MULTISPECIES: ATP-binding cassette domain-containing protein [unclassified Janthinobacterium]PKV46350.1 phospholipid/cholesterol/gamma-HCH transport system ATP-binding protein [Janthinobacterium sp. 61]TDY33386.1 phospholipid/cholesterol/gamma-HCH transport system ATP-binding protein [Janthinobacterium sp. 75]